MEHTSTRTAIENDHDFLTRIAHRWTDAIDQDGTEPTEEDLRHRQGAFLRRPRRGLHHLEIFATTDQYEHLLTVMNTATNPRTTTTPPAADGGDDDGTAAPATTATAARHRRTGRGAGETTPRRRPGPPHPAPATPRRPRRRLQSSPRHRHPARHRRTPPPGHGHHQLPGPPEPPRNHRRPRPRYATGTPARIQYDRPAIAGDPQTRHGRPGTGTFTFTGPVTASTIRKIACDADIIPVLLGSEGRILDIGRTTRIFPPHIRKALTARDQGCAFPNCTIPAPWCEAHHITYWSHGGPTSTDNGTLLCTHHHHLIHKEQWKIHVKPASPGSSRHPTSTPTKNPGETTTTKHDHAGLRRSEGRRQAVRKAAAWKQTGTGRSVRGSPATRGIQFRCTGALVIQVGDLYPK